METTNSFAGDLHTKVGSHYFLLMSSVLAFVPIGLQFQESICKMTHSQISTEDFKASHRVGPWIELFVQPTEGNKCHHTVFCERS